MKNKSTGFILSLIAAILSAVGMIIYNMVLFKISIVYVFLAFAFLLEILTFVMAKKNENIVWGLPVVNAALMACAIVWSIKPMVNTIGYVIAGLNEMSTVTGLILFLGVAILSMIINFIESFIA